MDKAKFYLGKIKDYVKSLDKKKRTLYIVIICVCVALSILLACILNYKDYVVLYSGLDPKECSSIVTELDKSSISYKLKGDDTIYVPSNDEAKVKMQLASKGYPQSALNYDIFTKNVDFMTTDYEKTEYSRMQLQERLQASIKTLDDVEDAIVTITIPNNSLAVLDADKVEPSASAIITLKNGVTLTKDQISGVQLLIARSVPNLTTKNVTLLDQSGAALNKDEDADTLISTSKFQTEAEMSKLISDRIKTTLSPVYGVNNLSIGVNVVIDTSAKASEKTEYTPTKDNAGVITKYDQNYQGTGNDSGATGVPGTKTNTDVTQYATTSSTTSDSSGSISNDVSVDYSVNKLTEQIKKQGAEISDLTVSVLINKQAMSGEELSQIKGIIANAAGISTDKVQLYNTEFTAANNAQKPADNGQAATPFSLTSLLSNKVALIIAGAVVLLLVITIVLLKIIKAKRKKRKLLEQMFAEEDEDDAAVPNKVKIEKVEKIPQITESKEQQITKEIKEFSAKAPQITASLLRTLLKGDLE